MGASSSIQNVENSIYVSYDSGQRNNPYILELCEELKRKGRNVIGSELMNKEFDKSNDVREIVKTMEQIVEHSNLIILCISQKTLSNYYQTIEMNSAIKSKQNILYLMTDENYTPEKKPMFVGLVKDKWLPLYEYDNISNVIWYINRKY